MIHASTEMRIYQWYKKIVHSKDAKKIMQVNGITLTFYCSQLVFS